MHVATLRMELRLSDGSARREKRRLMHEIEDKLRRHFNVALAEVDRSDPVGGAVLGVSTVAATRREARDTLERVTEAVAAHPLVEVLAITRHEI
jgi:uncharacterized protein YlxP (DUF503 family)